MRVLVTGGAGFVGHNLALYLAERGFDVVVLDSLERSTSFALERLRGRGIPILKVDARFFDGYKNFDVVVHAAAYVSVSESIERPVEYLDNNALGTAKVAYNCARHGARLVYLSSAAVYGNSVRLPVPKDHPINPVSLYGFSKWLGELIVNHLNTVYGLRYVILRLFNVYGPGQNPSYAGVVASFLERALRGEPLIIYGDGGRQETSYTSTTSHRLY
ncbi:MAG: NAD-dependent epimerase/dehydratase family protein [Ignisphaera sp.]